MKTSEKVIGLNIGGNSSIINVSLSTLSTLVPDYPNMSSRVPHFLCMLANEKNRSIFNKDPDGNFYISAKCDEDTFGYILRYIRLQGDLNEFDWTKEKYDLIEKEEKKRIEMQKEKLIKSSEYFGLFHLNAFLKGLITKEGEPTESFSPPDSKIIITDSLRRDLFHITGEKCVWKLLHRASKDGFKEREFHKRCNDVKNTLVIIKDKSGLIFGGFAHKTWTDDIGDGNKRDEKSYIFSLKNKKGRCRAKINVNPCKVGIYCRAATFGGSNGNLYFFPYQQYGNPFCYINVRDPKKSFYDENQTHLFPSKIFDPEEIEVYHKTEKIAPIKNLVGNILKSEKEQIMKEFIKENMNEKNEVVILNFSGKKVMTTSSILSTLVPGCPYFSTMKEHYFSKAIKKWKETKEEIIIWRDSEGIECILEYLREKGNLKKMNSILPSKGIKKDKLINDTEFYSLYHFNAYLKGIIDEDDNICDFYIPDSNILDLSMKKDLTEMTNHKHWKLLYRGTRDGFDKNIYKRKVEKSKKSLVIVRDTKGYVFGGQMVDAYPKDINKRISSDHWFVFSLKCSIGRCKARSNLYEKFNTIENQHREFTLGFITYLHIYLDGKKSNGSRGEGYQTISWDGFGKKKNRHFYDVSSFLVDEIEVYQAIDKAEKNHQLLDKENRNFIIREEEKEKMVTLNVGGKKFVVRESTLTNHVPGFPDTKKTVPHFFSVLLSNKFGIVRDSQGNIFIDREPTCMKYILEYLREGGNLTNLVHSKIENLPNDEEVRKIISDTEFFALTHFNAFLKGEINEKGEKMNFSESKILLGSVMRKNLGDITGEKKWKLIYRGSRDGFEKDAFFEKCENKEKVIVIIKDQHGCIFGGYNNSSWEILSRYFINSKEQERRKEVIGNYLFSLKNRKGRCKEVIKGTNKNYLNWITYEEKKGLILGRKNLQLSDNCSLNSNFLTLPINTEENSRSIWKKKIDVEDYYSAEQIENFDISFNKKLSYVPPRSFIVEELEIFQVVN